MMKKSFISMLTLFFALSVNGQTFSERTVSQFGDYMQQWCSTRNINFKNSVKTQCISGCRVNDKIMERFAIELGVSSVALEDYVLENYLDGFMKAFRKGTVNYRMSNIRTIDESQQVYSSYANSTAQQEAERSKKYVTVACDINITGSLNFHVQDLFYIYQGKVKKITPYVEVIDPNTGQKKVKVDFSDLVDLVQIDETRHGFRYGYSKLTPWNLSVVENFEKYENFGYVFQLGLLGGLLEPAYTVKDGDITSKYRVHCYLVVGPSLSIPYLTLNCGLGFVIFRKTIIEQNQYNDCTWKNTQGRFMVKPTISLDIPFADKEFYISPYAGYNFILGQKELNTWELGLGIQWEW